MDFGGGNAMGAMGHNDVGPGLMAWYVPSKEKSKRGGRLKNSRSVLRLLDVCSGRGGLFHLGYFSDGQLGSEAGG